jgi:hypothetical protein
MPGSWERSRLSDIDNPFHTDPPEPTLRRVFCFPKRGLFENRRRKPARVRHSCVSRCDGDGRPGSQGVQTHARSAGPVRRERGASRIPMTGRTNQGFAMAAPEFESAATEFAISPKSESAFHLPLVGAMIPYLTDTAARAMSDFDRPTQRTHYVALFIWSQ